MIRIREIDHLVLRVRDLEAMLAFYCDALGCSVERRLDRIGLVQLRAGDSLIDLLRIDGGFDRDGLAATGIEGRNLDHFCLRIEPFDEPAIRRALESRGVAVGPVVSRYGAHGTGPSIYLSDPEGNVVELKGPADTPADTLTEPTGDATPAAEPAAEPDAGTDAGALRFRATRAGEEAVLYQVFHSSVHRLASRDYTPEQIAAWAPDEPDGTAWARRIQSIRPFVIELDGAIAGYADLQDNGYITHFFVAGAFARRGIGSALLRHIHTLAARRGIAALSSDVSRTAQPLFERFGFRLIEQRQPVIRGVMLQNALMRKDLRADAEATPG